MTTSSYDPVTPYATGAASASARGIVESIAAWIESDPLADLVAAFGGATPQGTLEDRLAALEAFSSAHWDFRAGRERNLVAATEFDDEVAALVLDAAEALGLRTTTRPSRSSYDHVVVLGGLVRACLLRTRYAADLTAPDGVAAGDVTGLTAHRPLKGDEVDLIARAGVPDAGDEAAVMQAGLVSAFGLDGLDPVDRAESSEHEFGGSLVRAWAPTGRPPVRLVVAPSPEPTERRANSADTYTWWAENVASLRPGSSVLLVTSSIYVPYQNSGAVERLALPFGATVETVGLDFSRHEHGALRQAFGPQQYLQEIHSAIRGARALRDRAVEASYGPAEPRTPVHGTPITAPPPPADAGKSTRCPDCDVRHDVEHLPNCPTRRAAG